MSGIAGAIDLAGQRPIPPGTLAAMADALAHRGPDGEAFYEAPGVGLAVRRLGPAPAEGLANASGELALACHGALTAGPVAALWAGDPDKLLGQLLGPFAFALWDRRRRCLLLARDRLGVCPLYWARRGDWLLFASEVKGLLASGMVAAEADPCGIDHVFTFLGLPAARTCFRGVQALPPGHYLHVRARAAPAGEPSPRRYWDLEFPDRGDEEDGRDAAALADRLEAVLSAAVSRQLEAGGPTASYVSGGLDCSTVVALAGKALGTPVPTYTVRIADPALDESTRALLSARASGSEPAVLTCAPADLAAAYPRLVWAAESPVPDPSCASLLLLAERARADGHRAALAGDGADELFAGYAWFKVDRVLGMLDWVPGVRPSQWARRLFLKWTAPHVPWSNVRRIQGLLGGHNPWMDLYGLVSLSRSRFYTEAMRESLGGRIAYDDLTLDPGRMRRWHPLNRALYLGAKVHLPGVLLQGKGDRLAMHSALQLRYPFLDEEVVAFAARLHPRWKLRRLTDKYLLRQVAARHLPPEIARRPKSDFVAPFDSLYGPGAPPFVEQLLGDESLRRAGYFDPAAVCLWRQQLPTLRQRGKTRLSVGIGLAAVVATQLWHHTFLGGGLCDLPAPTAHTPAPAAA